MSRSVTQLASWEQTTKSSGMNQSKVSPSRPVTQAGQRRSKGNGDEPGQASPTRASVKEILDLERRLDESCCWNEIPVKTQFHSKTVTNSGQKSQNNSKRGNRTEMLDFDLNDIMLRVKHKSGWCHHGNSDIKKTKEHTKQTHSSSISHYSPLKLNNPFNY